MNCQICEKRQANFQFSQVVNGKKREVNVCDVCAKEKGYLPYPEEGYSLHDLLSGLFNFDSSQMETHQVSSLKKPSQLQCQKCELTFSEFKRTGKFGCVKCYETFASRLDPILRRVHSGNVKHFGKIPQRKGGNLHIKRQIETYQEKLQQLISEEAFEDAAIIRDKIRLLQREQSTDLEGDSL